ncbi:GNAT family N-acetyltransferase [Thiothrix lacustris]|uniref:GNAT family N-acetyltransferase n=1 Tax=Thiothrix lacustris TaxID=525917 RepID=UPI0027E43B7C|nr:GNAT family N-acetyltransferase [Thiothrix lacustris]WMP17787.1 GNAT family N-acetyltransferase [Thiothrix lacustris]
MSIIITTEHSVTQTPAADDIFSNPAFRAILAREFHLEAVHVNMQTLTIPAFRRNHWLGKQTLVLGAGFDKTGLIPELVDHDYAQVIEQLAHELTTTRVQSLEVRTTQHIPCLIDQSDKVELNVDIQPSVDAIWNKLSTNTRKNIRRPLKQGFTSTIGLNATLLDEFYQLYRMSLHDIGSLLHPKQFFTDLMIQCPAHMEIFVGYMDGIPVVSSVSFVSQDEVYGAWSGIHTDYKKHNVFLAMLWQMIEYCGVSGRKTYNLGRSSEGSNPHQFKLKLANRSHKIYYYQMNIAALPRSHSSVQDAASWLIRNTPEVVMNGLSRALIHKFY